MTNPVELATALDKYLRPQTFAIGVKFLKSKADLPSSVLPVSQTFKHRIATCQAFGWARRNRLTTAVFIEDMNCPVGVAVMGLAKRPDYVLNGSNTIGRYNRTKKAAALTEKGMNHFEVGEYCGLVVSPLDSCNFKLDLALIYVNAIQATRLIQAAVYEKGGRFAVSVIPGAVCADILVPPMKIGQCSLGFPCWGDRTHAGTSENELVFSIPVVRFGEIISGLKDSHEAGMTIPAPLPTSYEAQQPEVYKQYVHDMGLS